MLVGLWTEDSEQVGDYAEATERERYGFKDEPVESHYIQFGADMDDGHYVEVRLEVGDILRIVADALNVGQ